MLIPIATLAAAASIIVQRRSDDDEEEVAKRGLRFGLGLVLVCGAVVGGFHLARGTTVGGALEPLKNAGGVVGAAIGAPLRAGLGGAGAVIVLVAIGAARDRCSSSAPVCDRSRSRSRPASGSSPATPRRC